MLPKVFLALMASPAVVALIDDRAYPHGEAPQGTPYPYVTWSFPGGDATLPFTQTDADQFRVQINCWSNVGHGQSGVENVTSAVRDALEKHGHVVAYTNDGRDPDTQAYRLGFALDWWQPRDL